MSNDYAKQMRLGIKLPAEAKDGAGRLARFVPTENNRELVRVLAANGISIEIMAKLIKVAQNTFKKCFREELEDGRAMVTAKVGAALVKEAMAGNVAAQRYWLGTHGGPDWRIPKDQLMPDVFDRDSPRTTVHFYMPPNHRDEPEELEPPTIEGEVEPDQAA